MLETQQVRLHECQNCLVLLQCRSQPIIEVCHDMRFAPLRETVGEVDNLWGQVQDFDWLQSAPSPHWRRCSEEEQEMISLQIHALQLSSAPESSSLQQLDPFIRAVTGPSQTPGTT